MIKSKTRVRDFGEVYTPDWIVSDMIDLVWPIEPSKTFLEPSCWNGNFLAEVIKRKLQNCKNDDDIIISFWSIYWIDILHDNVSECINRILEYAPDHLKKTIKNILQHNIIQGDFLKMQNSLWQEIIITKRYVKDKKIYHTNFLLKDLLWKSE